MENIKEMASRVLTELGFTNTQAEHEWNEDEYEKSVGDFCITVWRRLADDPFSVIIEDARECDRMIHLAKTLDESVLREVIGKAEALLALAASIPGPEAKP